jgi:flagellar biosynthesis GTPase FlhF
MKRFHGSNVTEILKRVRAELGDDAVIITNRRVTGGVEIVAMADEAYLAIAEETHIPQSPAPAPAPAPQAAPASYIPTFQEAMAARDRQANKDQAEIEMLPNPFVNGTAPGALAPLPVQVAPGAQFRRSQGRSAYGSQADDDQFPEDTTTPEVRVKLSTSTVAQVTAPRPAVEPVPEPELEVVEAELVDEFEREEPAGPVLPSAEERFAEDLRKAKTITEWSTTMLGDLHSMQDLIRRQILPRVSQSNVYAKINQLLAKAGFQHDLCAQILSSLPGELAERRMDLNGVSTWVEHALVEQISVISSPDVWWGGRAVVAVVGSNGAGKTSSIAKLAGRFVMKNSPNEVVVLSTDVEQEATLRNHADLMGIEFHVIEDYQNLDAAVRSLSYKRLILIDTPGMSYRHKRLPAMMDRLSKVSQPLKVMLALNASSEAESLEAMTRAYLEKAQQAGLLLEDCIVTKLDEAVRIGALISTMTRHKLRLNYQSSGSGVLEDFERGSALSLVSQSMESYATDHDKVAVDGTRDLGTQFDATRDKILSNVSEMTDVLSSIRREFKNAGYVASTRSIVGLETSKKHQAYGKLIEEQKGMVQAPADPKPQLLWFKNDYQVDSAYFKLASPSGEVELSPYSAQKDVTLISSVN